MTFYSAISSHNQRMSVNRHNPPQDAFAMTTADPSQAARALHVDSRACDAYPADLYTPDGLAEVLAGASAVDAQAVAFFKDQGYLAVANMYTPQQIDQAKAALSDLIAGQNMEFNELSVENFSELKGKDRNDPMFKDPAKMEAIVRKVTKFTQVDARLKALAEHRPLVDAVEKLLGEKSVLYQEMALLKPPGGREKPWHQDHAYFNVDNAKHVVGVWIALDQATLANGCMHIMPGRHREPVLHFQRRDWQICDKTTLEIMDRCLAVPLEPGGVLFFDSFLPHGTPTNQSNQRRRAVQFHYKAVAAENIESEARMKIWGSEGKNVEC
jgi:phytanoyl-CoA hydroxylase